MSNQFGERIRSLREEQNLLLREVATRLHIDIPMLSKIERGERKAKRQQITVYAKILKTSKDGVLTQWLADQLIEVLKNEALALKAIQGAEEDLKYNLKKNAGTTDSP
jgi:transcriptional regulator with XRE-family HTH domain